MPDTDAPDPDRQDPSRSGMGLHVLDWPPVWTVAAVLLVWLAAQVWPWPVAEGLSRGLGGGLVGAGLALMGAAVVQMAMARTTVIPRRAPSRLVRGGVFAVSRNPIYLGDALVIAGAALWLQVPWMLPIVPVFARIITRRFILDEEARLRAAFGPEFQDWAARTGRWIG